MSTRRILRLIGKLQHTERDNLQKIADIEAAACQVEATGNLDYGAALRILADAFRGVDREFTRAAVKAIRELQEAHDL
jgi:hypothetical protein